MYLSLVFIQLLPELLFGFQFKHSFKIKNINLYTNTPTYNDFFIENNCINDTQNILYQFGAFPRLEGPNLNGELTWYPIGFPHEFSSIKSTKVTIRDINYIVWRDSIGYYGIRDACSHQGASFEGGCIKKNTVTCPYHGYKFNGQNGNLIDIPDLDIDRYSFHNIESFKVVEKSGIIYMNTVPLNNNTEQINENLIWIEPEATDINNKAVFLSEYFEHNAKFVSVNSLDICHIGFVHTFGNKKNPNPVLNSKIEKLDDSIHHYKISYDYLAGSNSLVNKVYKFNKITVENEYVLPHTTVARVIFGDFKSTIITVAQPISKFKTRLFVKAYRSYWYYDLKSKPFILQPFYQGINILGNIITHNTMFTTLKQDKYIVDKIDKTSYKTMHGKFSIKYDMMSTHYKNNYKKFFEYSEFNF